VRCVWRHYRAAQVRFATALPVGHSNLLADQHANDRAVFRGTRSVCHPFHRPGPLWLLSRRGGESYTRRGLYHILRQSGAMLRDVVDMRRRSVIRDIIYDFAYDTVLLCGAQCSSSQNCVENTLCLKTSRNALYLRLPQTRDTLNVTSEAFEF